MSNKLKRKSSAKPKAPLAVMTDYGKRQQLQQLGVPMDALKKYDEDMQKENARWKEQKDKEYSNYYFEEFKKQVLKKYDEIQKESREKVLMAEDYISVANLLISMVAINKTWGYTKACQRFLDNLNDARDYVESNGVEKTYSELQDQMGIELGFDSMDINKTFGFDKVTQEDIDEMYEDIYRRIKDNGSNQD